MFSFFSDRNSRGCTEGLNLFSTLSLWFFYRLVFSSSSLKKKKKKKAFLCGVFCHFLHSCFDPYFLLLEIKIYFLWCWREFSLESSMYCKKIHRVHPNGDHSWMFTGRTDVEAEAPKLWPPDSKSWFIGKDPETGKTEGRRRKGWQRMTWLDGIIDWMDRGLVALWELVMDRKPWHAAIHWVVESWTGLSDWTELNWSGLGFRGSAPLEYFFYYLGLVIFNLIMPLSRATRSTTKSSATERKLWHQDPHFSLPFLEVGYFMIWSAMTLNQRGPRTFLLCVCGSNHCRCCEAIPIIMSQVK